MKLIINVPDEMFTDALALAVAEMQDHQRRYNRPGWGWTFRQGGNRFWVRGINGGISISHSPLPIALAPRVSPSSEDTKNPTEMEARKNR